MFFLLVRVRVCAVCFSVWCARGVRRWAGSQAALVKSPAQGSQTPCQQQLAPHLALDLERKIPGRIKNPNSPKPRLRMQDARRSCPDRASCTGALDSPNCPGVAPVLRWCCDGVVPLCIPCTSLVHPLYVPCTSLVHPLYIPCTSLVLAWGFRQPCGVSPSPNLVSPANNAQIMRCSLRDLNGFAIMAKCSRPSALPSCRC